MKRISRVLTIMIALTMFVSLLSGCGGSGTTSQTTTQAATDAATAATTTTTATTPAASTTEAAVNPADLTGELTFMLHTTDVKNEPTFNALWEGFQKTYPKVKVTFVGNDGPDEQTKKVKLAAESGSLTDIFWILDPTAKEMASGKYLMDLSGFLSEHSNVASAVPESMIKGFTQDNFVYGLPFQCNVEGFWVNKAIFKKYGVTPPTQGTTYEELMEMVKVFSKNGVPTFINAAKSPFSCWTFLTAWARFGYYDHIQGILAGTDKFNNPDYLKYFQKLAELQKAGAFLKNITTTDYTQAVTYFSTGKGAMYDCGSWQAGSKEFAALGDDIDFWWGPVFSDGVGNQKVSMKIPSAPLCVSAKVADDPAKKAVVYAFLDYYYGSEESSKLVIGTGSVPVTNIKGAIETDIKPLKALLNALSFNDWVSPSAGPDMLVSTEVQNVMYDSLYGVMSGIYKPEQALDNLDAVESKK